MILRSILGAQAKVAVETLYLETASMSIRCVISVRRIIYLKTILSRHNDEVTKKVYLAMKANPYKGDWYYQVQADLQKFGIVMNEQEIEETDLPTFKKTIKTCVWNAFFKEMQAVKLTHTKVKHIPYSGERKPQSYLTNKKFNNEMCSVLFNLRCESTNQFKDNFHSIYGKTHMCKCGKAIDTQSHALACELVKRELTQNELDILNNVKYSDVYGSVDQQYSITKIFQRILQIRDTFFSSDTSLPGLHNSGPG
jgi:hypothetical protein